jgi:hypothetical protein
VEDQRLKQWIADFHREFLDALVRRAAGRESQLSRLYAEPCPKHEGCVRVVLADVVISHSAWANAAPAAVTAAVLNRILSMLGCDTMSQGNCVRAGFS